MGGGRNDPRSSRGARAPLRIFLVDDHPIVLQGMRVLVESQRDLRVVGEADRGEGLARRVSEAGADLLVIDVSLPGMGGAKATELALREMPSLRVLALSAYDEPSRVEQMLAAGAHGYLLKTTVSVELVGAIRVVARGGTYLDPRVAGPLLRGAAPRRVQGALSEREEEVLRLVARGHSYKEIADALRVSVRTIETYRLRATDKLGLRSRVDIVRFASERGWLGEG